MATDASAYTSMKPQETLICTTQTGKAPSCPYTSGDSRTRAGATTRQICSGLCRMIETA